MKKRIGGRVKYKQVIRPKEYEQVIRPAVNNDEDNEENDNEDVMTISDNDIINSSEDNNANNNTIYNVFTDTDASLLRTQYNALYNGATQTAIKLYISPKAYDFNNFSLSQSLNNKLNKGMKLDVTENYVDQTLQKAFHPLGKNAKLTRGAHQDVLQALGINNYYTMSEQQLKNALIGASWSAKSYQSTSYNNAKNPFTSGAQAGGREVILKINAKGTTKVFLGAKNQAEIVLNKGTNYKITNVRYTGDTATPRTASRSYPVLELEVEAW